MPRGPGWRWRTTTSFNFVQRTLGATLGFCQAYGDQPLERQRGFGIELHARREGLLVAEVLARLVAFQERDDFSRQVAGAVERDRGLPEIPAIPTHRLAGRVLTS